MSPTLFEQPRCCSQSKSGVIAVDDSGEVTLINHAAQALLDYRKRSDDAARLSTLSHAVAGGGH